MFEKFLTVDEIRAIAKDPYSRDRHHGWLRTQSVEAIQGYIWKLEWILGFGSEFYFPKGEMPDQGTVEGCVEIIRVLCDRI